MSELVGAYLREHPDAPSGALAYVANLETVAKVSPGVAAAIVQELADQRANLKLIASENYSSLSTQCAMGNLLTDKYAEGVPYKRFYAGCDNVDFIEDYAAKKACELFGADYAYAQPHSGADANLVAFWAILSARVEAPVLAEHEANNALALEQKDWDDLRKQFGNQRLLGMSLNSGGHLTHGYRLNISAKMFDAHAYDVDKETGLLDYDAIERQAKDFLPLVLLAGYSAYPRLIDFERMRKIADSVGAVFMVDMAHFAGLVAGKVFEGPYDPVKHAHVVTTTTHKTLRGPRGGLVLCTEEFAEFVAKGCPLVLGGPLPHMMAAKAICFTEALQPAYRDYAKRIVENANALADACTTRGLTVVTGGTDNHLMLLDVRPFGITGRQAETAMRECAVTLNRNTIPFDPNGPWYTSGLRLGTPAVTTLGMGPAEMDEIAAVFELVLKNTKPKTMKSGKQSPAKYTLDPNAKAKATEIVGKLLDRFPVYPELDLDILQENFMMQEAAPTAS
jgi:glycine hydroxymethyltransferase